MPSVDLEQFLRHILLYGEKLKKEERIKKCKRNVGFHCAQVWTN